MVAQSQKVTTSLMMNTAKEIFSQILVMLPNPSQADSFDKVYMAREIFEFFFEAAACDKKPTLQAYSLLFSEFLEVCIEKQSLSFKFEVNDIKNKNTRAKLIKSGLSQVYLTYLFLDLSLSHSIFKIEETAAKKLCLHLCEEGHLSLCVRLLEENTFNRVLVSDSDAATRFCRLWLEAVQFYLGKAVIEEQDSFSGTGHHLLVIPLKSLFTHIWIDTPTEASNHTSFKSAKVWQDLVNHLLNGLSAEYAFGLCGFMVGEATSTLEKLLTGKEIYQAKKLWNACGEVFSSFIKPLLNIVIKRVNEVNEQDLICLEDLFFKDCFACKPFPFNKSRW